MKTSPSSSVYKVQDQYSETIKLENQTIENLINKTYQDLLIKTFRKAFIKMIIKSYEVQKNRSNLLKYNFFLLYGENFGLKKDIKDIIKIAIKQKNDSLEILSLYETEIFDNEENFYNSIYSGSLFSNKKIITIFDATDKIMKKIR